MLKTHMKLPKMSHVWQIFLLLSLARAAFAFFFQVHPLFSRLAGTKTNRLLSTATCYILKNIL